MKTASKFCLRSDSMRVLLAPHACRGEADQDLLDTLHHQITCPGWHTHGSLKPSLLVSFTGLGRYISVCGLVLHPTHHTLASARADRVAQQDTHALAAQPMWQPNLLQAAKLLEAGMKRLQTVDPDEGSNIWPARLAGMM